MAEIDLRGMAYRYPGAASDTLQSLDLRIPSGEAHALLGSSGSGKSTLLNLLSGLLPMQKGELLIDGVNVADVRPAARRVSQVFQFPVLYEAMTVAANLAFPLINMGVSRAARLARVAEIAGHLEVTHLLYKRPAQLSLYQKQLITIGKALMREDVSLVLLDEPLTAAEPARKWQLRRVLKMLQKASGATMIYVTHDQTEALTFADRISVLHEGRILQTAPPDGLLDAPSHEYIGHFVGAPGMNFFDAVEEADGVRVAGVLQPSPRSRSRGDCRLGFRPDWGELVAATQAEPAHGLPAEITSIRILGTRRRRPLGLIDARVGNEQVTTRQMLGGLAPGAARLLIRRSVLFRDGVLVDA